MPHGFVPYLLTHLKNLTQENYQGTKITPSGFLQALVENSPSLQVTDINGTAVTGQGGQVIKLSTSGGHLRSLKVKYLPRILASQVQTSDDCTNDQIFSYSEADINAPYFRSFSFFLDWNTVERYEAESSQVASLGVPAYGAIKEVIDQLMHVVNGLVTSMDTALLGGVTWGINPRTGVATTSTININGDQQRLNLNEGLIQIIQDARNAEFVGTPILVGSGLMDSYFINRQLGAFGVGANGVNNGAMGSPFKYYYDIQATTSWGANQVGAFAPNTVGFVDVDKYIAWKTGRFGTSWFATIALPVATPTSTTSMTFNIQIKEHDSPNVFVPFVIAALNRFGTVIPCTEAPQQEYCSHRQEQ